MFSNRNPLVIALSFVLFVSTEIEAAGGATADRLQSCDAKVAISAAEEVTKGKAHLQEPVLLLRAAAAFYQNGRREDAVFWYFAGHLRTRQQMVVDGRAPVGFAEAVMIGQRISVYGQSDAARLDAVLGRVLEWDAKTANIYVEKAKGVSDHSKQIENLYAEYAAFRVRLSTEKSFIEGQHKGAAGQMDREYEKHFGSRCRGG
ncbi:MAG: hypothetical protein WC830_13500 [Burkholderiales bacterium]|jgi:hypothetical protein